MTLADMMPLLLLDAAVLLLLLLAAAAAAATAAVCLRGNSHVVFVCHQGIILFSFCHLNGLFSF